MQDRHTGFRSCLKPYLSIFDIEKTRGYLSVSSFNDRACELYSATSPHFLSISWWLLSLSPRFYEQRSVYSKYIGSIPEDLIDAQPPNFGWFQFCFATTIQI
ncbi:hypothetical protein RF11_07740 [Thelohanellus kitauei]|uniref:Uncharacterized protein n=1 Tax=Thelohanellus kitauei TaxID=669202 RepID=A0A0C2MCQ3_THEKT|nr:hypothetical protein RF11_07740 [Thelohanellus kitauei]